MDPQQNKLILYTNHTCTWANRVNVALSELEIPFEERIINVDGPRPASFLEINPRALVPVLIFNGEIIIESTIVCQFLVDIYPSHLCPQPITVQGALKRASMSFFTDAYWTKFHVILFRLFEAEAEEVAERAVNDAVAGLLREVEPLLKDAGPFFGGSGKLTLAEVLMGPFVIRAMALSRHGVYPASLVKQIGEKAPSFHGWATAVCKHPSITAVFDEKVHVARSWAKRDRMRDAAGLTKDWMKKD